MFPEASFNNCASVYPCCKRTLPMLYSEKRLVQLQTRATTHGWVFESKHTGLAVWLSDWLDATMMCYCVLYGNGTLFNDCCLLSPYHCDEPWFVELFINGHCICSCICCANFVGFEANVPASIQSSSASCRSVCSKKRHAHIPSRTPRNVIPLVFSTGSVWPFIRCFQYADFYIGMQSKKIIPGLLAALCPILPKCTRVLFRGRNCPAIKNRRKNCPRGEQQKSHRENQKSQRKH